MLKFQIEQIALSPTNPTKARKLLEDLGLTKWFKDNVHAEGSVYGIPGENHALLQFNYQATPGFENPTMQSDPSAVKPLELEVLHYVDGPNWMQRQPNTVSHLGMHVTYEQLEEFRKYFYGKGIGVAQEVYTQGHTNPHIRDSRRYHYVIFDTRSILSVDLKFIVRMPVHALPPDTDPVEGPSAMDDDPRDSRGRRIGNRRKKK
jgi:hypothetical protein